MQHGGANGRWSSGWSSNAKTNDGQTALDSAAGNGHADVVKLLEKWALEKEEEEEKQNQDHGKCK